MNRDRIGGISALTLAATFVVGFVVGASALSDYTAEDATPAESVEFVADNEALLYVWNLVIFLVFGAVLVVLALALDRRLRDAEPVLARTATAFGLIWAGLVLAAGMIANIGLGSVVDLGETDPAQAEAVWSSLDAVQNGLGGGIELVGGLWVLLVSVAALRAHDLGRGLNILGVVVGIAGVVSIVPVPEAVLAVFGLGLIVWFVWLGVLLLGDKGVEAAPSPS